MNKILKSGLKLIPWIKLFFKHKEDENSGTVFAVKLLENIYIDILKFHIFVESHVTRFSKVLK